nr:helix-turn-helix domain-containing protein [Methylobacterium sp. L1A1]
MSGTATSPSARVTPAAAAKRLGVSTSYLSNLRRAKDGGGPVFYQIGRKIEYAPEDLDRWLEERRRTTTARRLGPKRSPNNANNAAA